MPSRGCIVARAGQQMNAVGSRVHRDAAHELLGMGEGAQALAEIGELEQLAEQLSQSYAGATMEDVDLDMLARLLGEAGANR